jgi:ATP/maltotriose-dependent transcriptional regulator MalT
LQRFLLRTSITDYLPAELMERLAGLPGSKKEVAAEIRSIIKNLRNRNLFVTAVDDEASGIRYHALFREFLHRKLTTLTDPAVVRKIYSTASSYFESSGDSARMVDLLISSGQFEQAVRQIESKGLRLIARGQIQTVLRWVQALPLDCGNRPWFLLYRNRFPVHQSRAALTFFDLALRASVEPEGPRRNAGQDVLALRLHRGMLLRGRELKRMAQAAAEAAPLLKRQTGASPEARARLALAIGMAFFFIGRLRLGTEYLRRSFELFQKSGDYFFQIQSAIYLAPCSIYHGDFAGSRAAIRRGFEALKSIPHETGGEAGLHMAQAMTALFEGLFTEAQECINLCFSLAHKHDFEAFNFLSLDIGGWIKTASL